MRPAEVVGDKDSTQEMLSALAKSDPDRAVVLAPTVFWLVTTLQIPTEKAKALVGMP